MKKNSARGMYGKKCNTSAQRDPHELLGAHLVDQVVEVQRPFSDQVVALAEVAVEDQDLALLLPVVEEEVLGLGLPDRVQGFAYRGLGRAVQRIIWPII